MSHEPSHRHTARDPSSDAMAQCGTWVDASSFTTLEILLHKAYHYMKSIRETSTTRARASRVRRHVLDSNLGLLTFTR